MAILVYVFPKIGVDLERLVCPKPVAHKNLHAWVKLVFRSLYFLCYRNRLAIDKIAISDVDACKAFC